MRSSSSLNQIHYPLFYHTEDKTELDLVAPKLSLRWWPERELLLSSPVRSGHLRNQYLYGGRFYKKHHVQPGSFVWIVLLGLATTDLILGCLLGNQSFVQPCLCFCFLAIGPFSLNSCLHLVCLDYTQRHIYLGQSTTSIELVRLIAFLYHYRLIAFLISLGTQQPPEHKWFWAENKTVPVNKNQVAIGSFWTVWRRSPIPIINCTLLAYACLVLAIHHFTCLL